MDHDLSVTHLFVLSFTIHAANRISHLSHIKCLRDVQMKIFSSNIMSNASYQDSCWLHCLLDLRLSIPLSIPNPRQSIIKASHLFAMKFPKIFVLQDLSNAMRCFRDCRFHNSNPTERDITVLSNRHEFCFTVSKHLLIQTTGTENLPQLLLLTSFFYITKGYTF